MTLEAGTKLGRYEIRSKLGEGGMGEVYLAQDTKLDRTVALKVLPADLANDQSRMRRFTQEARTASSLSHPNVAHIYEIEEIDGVHFIAMEFIDGETLRHRISRGELPLAEVLELSMQVAAALSAAHAAGITHRDIKPDNVMLRPDGYVKVLDFGLAKLSERAAEPDKEAPTRAMVNTDPGTVMGTVGYMSPEQARGQTTDARTDIWSLGVVIYQMVSHHLPFEASSNSDVIASILGKEPPPMARYARDVPEALEWVVTKALTKDPDERYQTAKEMMVDLRRIKQKLDAQSEIERSSSPDSARVSSGISAPTQPTSAHSTAHRVQMSTAGSIAPATSSAEYIVSEIKRHKIGLGVISLFVIAVLVAGGFGLYKLAASNKSSSVAPAIKFTRLTSGGKIGNESITGGASISPDGKYIVFWTVSEAKSSCYVRQISTNSLVRIAGPIEYFGGGGTTFSPDGEFVYFNETDKNNRDGALYRVPVLGGTPQKILEGIWSTISFSPDGKQITYVRLFPATGESWLVVANADGSGAHTIATRKLPDYYESSGPSWSPDGQRIAVGATTIPESRTSTIVEVPVGGGKEHAITPPQWVNLNRVLWTSDGKGLVVSVWPTWVSTGTQLWYISYPDGATRPITNDLNGYGTISLGLTGDSKTIATVQEDVTRTIWLASPNQDASQARQISNGKYEGLMSLDGTTDGRIVYLDFSGSATEIWIMKADGTEKRQLTSDGFVKATISVSPDGQHILYTCYRSGSFDIWRVGLDGGNPRQLTTNESLAVYPVGTPDGKWVVFQSFHDGKWALWKVSIDGGQTIRLTDTQNTSPDISPDGKWIACLTPDEKTSTKWRIAILPIEGGAPTKLIDQPPNLFSRPKWSPDGRALTFLGDDGSANNIYSLPLDGGGQPKPLTNFKSDWIGTFSWTRDGKLILGRGPTVDDVVLIKDYR